MAEPTPRPGVLARLRTAGGLLARLHTRGRAPHRPSTQDSQDPQGSRYTQDSGPSGQDTQDSRTGSQDAQESGTDNPRTRSSRAWRFAVPVACACVGLLATTSMVNARGTDLRGGRSTELVDIVAAQRTDAEQLNDRIDTVEEDIARLTAEIDSPRLRELERQIDELAVSAGMTGLAGPGLTVTLDDAPLDQSLPEGFDTNRLLVHQEDLQAVVNAMWAGGAEGISLQGQRIISTTGIKCVGNSVLLQGVPYAPPYEIVAVGDDARMYDALLTSPQVQAYRADVEQYALGWSLVPGEDLALPAFTGTPDLEFARAGAVPDE